MPPGSPRSRVLRPAFAGRGRSNGASETEPDAALLERRMSASKGVRQIEDLGGRHRRLRLVHRNAPPEQRPAGRLRPGVRAPRRATCADWRWTASSHVMVICFTISFHLLPGKKLPRPGAVRGVLRGTSAEEVAALQLPESEWVMVAGLRSGGPVAFLRGRSSTRNIVTAAFRWGLRSLPL